nr:ribonuclease H-like domain-containing protein [Tanacetum cinerariifolium]
MEMIRLSNEDVCYDPGDNVDEIELLLHHDPSTLKMSVAFILEGFTNEPPLKENDDLFDLESKENEWKKILYDAPINDLMTEDTVFYSGIHENILSPTCVKLPFKDRHFIFFTYVIQIFPPYFTYPVDSPFILSSRSEDTIFDPSIFAFHFLASMASHQSGTIMCFNVYPNILNESPMDICSSTRFNPNITMIRVSEGSPITTTARIRETYKNVSQDIRDQLNAEAEAVQIILTGINNDIYSTVDACPNACEMWKAIERLKQCESINVQDLETNLYWEFGKFTSQDGESLESYYSRAKKIARVANPLALVAQQQPVYHPQHHPTQFTQNSLTRSQQVATRNKGKAIVNTPQPIYDQEPSMVDEDDKTSKDKEIDKFMALISLSFKKIYKPTNNNLRTSSDTSRANQDNSQKININAGYENQRIGNVAGARETVGSTVVQKSGIQCYNCKEVRHVVRECQKPKRGKDTAYHREKMLLCKQEEAGIQLNAEQADWKDNTNDDELEDPELEAHYITHPEQSKSMHDTYPIEQDAQNVIIDSLDMTYDREEIDQNDDDNDLAKERELLASLIEKLKGEIEDFKNKNKSLESSNNFFKEANNRLSETNNLLHTDYKKSEAELARRNSMEYTSQMELECAKVRCDFLSYKMDYQKSCNKYTAMINDLNQTISKLKDKLSAHQETISILSKQKEA